jgi:phosphoribosylglycinamide formyltransferase-1
VLASHEGTTLQAVLDACASDEIPARVALVISNNAGSGALRRACTAGVQAQHLSATTHPEPSALDRALSQALAVHGVELVLLAGYMKKLGPITLADFAGRILNTHPALLPRFGGQGLYGAHVHRAVLAAGERESGATLHRVDAEYDTGPAIAQIKVPVEVADTPETLAARVQAAERTQLVRVLGEIASGARPWPMRSGSAPGP